MSGQKLCPTCGSDHVIKVVDVDLDRWTGFKCEWCGAEWPRLAPVPRDPAANLPAVDPIRGGRVE
jgi:transposase-like protein